METKTRTERERLRERERKDGVKNILKKAEGLSCIFTGENGENAGDNISNCI
jgi:hypothetical protein